METVTNKTGVTPNLVENGDDLSIQIHRRRLRALDHTKASVLVVLGMKPEYT